MSEPQPTSGPSWSTIVSKGRNIKVPSPYRRTDEHHKRDLFSINIMFEDPSITAFRKSQQVASIIQTALTPGSVIFSIPLTQLERYTDAYRQVVRQLGPVSNNGFNPISLRGARSKNEFIFSTKFLDPDHTKAALETGVTINEVQYKAVPYKEKSLVNDHVRVNLTLTSYDSDNDILTQDLISSMSHYGKVVQIKQRLHEGFFEGEISVLLDRSDSADVQYVDLDRMLYLEAWDNFFPASFKGAPPVCYYCRKSGHITKQCPSLLRITCPRCKDKGHTERFCTKSEAEILDQYAKDSQKADHAASDSADISNKSTNTSAPVTVLVKDTTADIKDDANSANTVAADINVHLPGDLDIEITEAPKYVPERKPDYLNGTAASRYAPHAMDVDREKPSNKRSTSTTPSTTLKNSVVTLGNTPSPKGSNVKKGSEDMDFVNSNNNDFITHQG